MAKANADTCIAITIDDYEGGYDTNPKDRGNWTSGKIGEGQLKGTKYGIAAFVYSTLDIKNLSKSDAIGIYKRDYWPKVAGDQLPEGVDFTAWDACVNSGSGRALKWLATGLGASLAAASSLAVLAVAAPDKIGVIKKANAARRSFLIGLHNATFERGWLRRVSNVEARSIAMQLTAQKKTPAEIKTELTKEARESDTAKKTTGAGSGGSTAATTAQASQHEWAWDWATAGEVALIAAAIGIIVYFGWKAVLHHQRAKEMRAVAATI